MARPNSNLKWIDFLLERTREEGSWAKAAAEQPLTELDALNATGASADTVKLEVAAKGGDAAILVAMKNGEVKFVHNLSLAKAAGEFVLVGTTGLGHLSTFVVITGETILGTFNPPRRGVAPTVDDMWKATSAAAFKALKTRVGSAETQQGLEGNYHGGIFWCHPALWKLMPNRATSAHEVAMNIIKNFPSLTETVEGMEVTVLSEHQRQLEVTLRWLWTVANEIISGDTPELPDDDEFERACVAIQAKISRMSTGAATAPTTAERMAGGATEAAFRDAVSSMARIQERLLESQLQDRERKRMTHRFTDEGKQLFQLLSATDWADYEPATTRFTERLLADKDAGKALQYVQGEVERGRWSCALSNHCLIQFFAQGYVGRDYQTAPSGLTVFMCRPISVPKPTTQKEKEFIIRSTFGKSDLGDDGVKLFAKSDLHIPKSFDELTKQLDCTVKFLQLLNGDNNIGLQGYQTALTLLHENEQELAQLATQRTSVWAQLAFAFDTAFQRFLRRFTHIITTTADGDSAIERGRHTLQMFMKDDIATLFLQVPYGHLPNLALPGSLTSHQTPNDTHDDDSDAKPPPSPANSNAAPKWFSENPSPIAAWMLPKAANFADVFDFNDERRRAFSSHWPRLPHHKTGTVSYSCPRYQTTGRCRARCKLAHCPSGKLPREAHEEMDAKIKAALDFIKKT